LAKAWHQEMLLLLPLLLGSSLVWAQQQKKVIRVRYGYFPQARPQHAACARGWLDLTTDKVSYKVICFPQSSGVFAASRLDNGQLDIANLGSTPWAAAISRGVNITAVYVAAYLGAR